MTYSPHCLSQQTSRIPSALELFDKLPDSAYVSINVIRGIYGCSNATIWRRIKSGEIAQPVKLGKRTTRWQVGILRRSLEQIALYKNAQGEES